MEFKTKFMKLKPEDILVQGGYVGTSHFIFSLDWLQGLKPKRSLGMVGFMSTVTKAAVAETKRILDGKSPRDLLPGYMASIDFSGYRPSKKIETHEGLISMRTLKKGLSFVSFGVKGTPYVDCKYAAALFFDDSAHVFIKGDFSPVLLLSAEKIVAAIAPLNPDRIKPLLKNKE
jgi:hypothetical protein